MATPLEFEERLAAAEESLVLPKPEVAAPISLPVREGLIEQIADLYPKSVIMPEHYQQHFGARADNGRYAAIPAALTLELMNSLCPLANEGKKIGDTHILVYVPKTIGTNPFSISTMVEKYATSLFWDQNNYGNQAIKDATVSEAGWMLIPRLDLPGSKGKTLEDREQVLAQFKQVNESYEVVEALPLVTALVFESLVYNQKSFVDFSARTATAPSPSSRVVVGNFDAGGMGVHGWSGGNAPSGRGLALFRNLKI
jgi:hypothetical protein